MVDQIVGASDDELMATPGAVVYRIDALEAIECKRPLIATNPDFVIVCNDGTRQKYGLASAIAVDGVSRCTSRLLWRPHSTAVTRVAELITTDNSAMGAEPRFAKHGHR